MRRPGSSLTLKKLSGHGEAGGARKGRRKGRLPAHKMALPNTKIRLTTCGRGRGFRSRPKPRPPGALALGTGLSARGRALAHAIGASARAASRRQTRGDAAARRTPSSCRLRGFNGTPEAPPCAPILRTRRRRARAHAHRALETRPCGGAAARTRPGCAPYARRWEF